MALIGAALLVVGGCTAAPAPPPEPVAPTVVPPPPPSQPATQASALQAGFEEFADTVPAAIGIALAPVGGTEVTAFGAWSTGVAWSTIKVPLAIAALRRGDPDAQALAVAAITRSDNAAAEQLWSQLGAPEQAARQVRAILAEGGDATTAVESHRLRPGFTAFGQTQWALPLQARFAARLPCMADAGAVVELMHHLVEGQRWGLAAEGSAAAKGGWGPGQTGGYLVRQFGIISTPAGQLGVALAAEPHAGTFGAGVEALNQMTGWLTGHASELPGGNCAR